MVLVKKLDGITKRAMEQIWREGTKQNFKTSVTKFIMFVLVGLGGTIDDLKAIKDPREWTEEMKAKRLAMTIGYFSHCTVNQKTVEAGMKDLYRVMKFFRIVAGGEIFHESAMTEVNEYTRGLREIKAHVKKQREGFSAEDVVVLGKQLKKWGKTGRKLSKKKAATMDALNKFAFIQLLRVGEAVADNVKFSNERHLARSHFTFQRHRDSGELICININPPKMKVNNILTDLELVVYPTREGAFCLATTLDRLFHVIDPVNTLLWGSTPAFRNPDTGEPLLSRTLLEWNRKAVIANYDTFGSQGREPEQFGNHSFRIGGVGVLVRNNVPELVLQGMGRWVSECYRLYLRTGRDMIQKYQTLMASKKR